MATPSNTSRRGVDVNVETRTVMLFSWSDEPLRASSPETDLVIDVDVSLAAEAFSMRNQSLSCARVFRAFLQR